MTASSLILPGTLEWEIAKNELPPPPGWQEEIDRRGGNCALIAPIGQHGLMEVVPLARASEYIEDGELDQRQDEIEEFEPDYDLWLPGQTMDW